MQPITRGLSQLKSGLLGLCRVYILNETQTDWGLNDLCRDRSAVQGSGR